MRLCACWRHSIVKVFSVVSNEELRLIKLLIACNEIIFSTFYFVLFWKHKRVLLGKYDSQIRTFIYA